MFDIISIYLITILVFNSCIFFGLGFQKILSISENNYFDEYWLSPILGMSILMFFSIFIGYFFGYLFPFTFLFFISLLVFFIFLTFKDLNIKKLNELNLLFLILSIVPLGTLILYGGYNSHNDSWTYISQAQWLQENPFSKKTDMSGFYPMQSQISLYQNMGSRMGASYFLGFIQSVTLMKWSYYAYLSCLSVSLISTVCLLVSYFKKKFENLLNISIACSLLIITQNGFVSSGNYGFYPQTFGLAFLNATIIFILIFFEELKKTNSFSKKFILILSIFFSSLLYSYNDIAPIVALCLFLFLILETKFNLTYIKKILPGILFFVAFVLIIVNVEFVRIFDNFISGVKHVGSGDIRIGWPVLWNPIQFFAHSFGLKSILDYDLFFLETILSIYGFLIFFVVSIFFVFKLKLFFLDDYKTFFNLFISFNFIFLILFFKFRYFSSGFVENETGNTFLLFKLYGWLSVINIPFMIYTYLLFYKNFKPRFQKILFTIISISFLLGLFLHGFFIPKYSTKQAIDNVGGNKYPLIEYLKFRNKVSENVDKNQVIYLSFGAERHKLRQMVTYILYDFKLISDYTDDGYITGNILPEERNIPATQADFILSFDLNAENNIEDSNIIFKHNLITLRKMPIGIVILDSVKGADNRESSGTDTWRWIEDSVEYKFFKINEKSNKSWILSFETLPAGFERDLKIEILDKQKNKIYEKTISTGSEWKKHRLLLEELTDVFYLTFNSSGKKVQLSEFDKRERKFLIKNLNIKD